MNSRERVRCALNHQEPDYVPLDLGGTGLTTLHITAYQNLRRHLEMPQTQARIGHIAEQLAVVDDDIAERLQTDVRPVIPGLSSKFRYAFRDKGAYEAFTDEWGIGWRKPKDGGFYYDMYYHPLADADSLDELRAYPFPDPLDDQRFATLREQAEAAVSISSRNLISGIETSSRAKPGPLVASSVIYSKRSKISCPAKGDKSTFSSTQPEERPV